MKKVWLMLVMLVSAVLLAGCAELDVIKKYGLSSIRDMTQTYPALVFEVDGYYHLTVDGNTTLLVSADYSATSGEDVVIKTPIAPFIDAGLNISALPEGYRADEEWLYLTADYGEGSGRKDDFASALFESVAHDRAALSYHTSLDHFGIDVTGGKVEWAKTHQTNDKDIVFVIMAMPLEELGVDVRNIDGWVFMTMDDHGNSIDVLLKPFEL